MLRDKTVSFDRFPKQEVYLIGQQVILNGTEIGTVVKSETGRTIFGAWVFSPSRGYASDYALTSIKPIQR